MRLALISLLGIAALAGCASAAQPPDWFAQRAADDSDYPSLRDVPRTTTANTDAEHWAEVRESLTAAGQAVRSDPRSAPASATQSPSVFLDEAREDIEDARQAHEPN